MAQWCETCGQRLPDDGSAGSSTVLGEEPVAHTHGAASPAGRPSGARGDGRLLRIVVGLLAGWAVFVVGGRLVSPDESAAPAEPVVERQPGAERPVDDDSRAEPLGEYEAADAAPGFVGAPVPDRIASQRAGGLGAVGEREADEFAAATVVPVPGPVSQVQVERLQRQLARRGSDAAIAYRAEGGVAVVDLREAETYLLDSTSGATTADAGIELLRAGSDTFGIDPVTLTSAHLVDDGRLLVTRSLSGSTFYVGSDGSAGQAPEVDVMTAAGVAVSYPAPRAHQLVAFDGLGLLAVPEGPSGGTLIAGDSGFEPLSEHRVLTANAVAILEQLCETPIDCRLEVSATSGEPAWAVPRDFVGLGDTYFLSPDGLALLRVTPQGFAEMYLSQSQSVLWVIGAGMESPAWGPDSNYIAWLDLVGDPKLKVMFPDERDWLTIDLGDLGAPTPAGPELLLFTPLHRSGA